MSDYLVTVRLGDTISGDVFQYAIPRRNDALLDIQNGPYYQFAPSSTYTRDFVLPTARGWRGEFLYDLFRVDD